MYRWTKGSAHPNFENTIYPVDCGYLKGITTIGGEGIDIFLGESKIKKVDLINCDSEVTLLIGGGEIEKNIIYNFINCYSGMKGIFVSRGI